MHNLQHILGINAKSFPLQKETLSGKTNLNLVWQDKISMPSVEIAEQV
jgi:hypothetical protein